jgi:DNA-directed RNA polymerase specialized sigma24 family protein
MHTEAGSAGDWLLNDSELDDSELVERARAGDLSAYEALIRRYQEVAFRTAYLITGEVADAEEVAQDALVKAHRALSRFRPGALFRPWLLQIVANEARNRRKAQAPRRVRLPATEDRHRGWQSWPASWNRASSWPSSSPACSSRQRCPPGPAGGNAP